MKNVVIATVNLALLAAGCGPPGSGPNAVERVGGSPSPRRSARGELGGGTPVRTLPGSPAAMHVIDSPGSYVLSGDLTGVAGKSAIEIAAHDVTLDLMGFALVGVPDALDGVSVASGRRNIVILNGTIRGWPQAGIDGRGAANSRFEGLQLHANRLEGLMAGIGSVVARCAASDNGGDGIATDAGCVVTDCTAWRNGLGGFGGDGIDAGDGSTVTDCAARDNADAGVHTGLGCTVARCSSRDNSGDGIWSAAQTAVTDCTASFNTSDGVHADSGATITGCTMALNGGDGIEISSFSFVIRNNVSVNGLSADEAAGILVTGLDNRIEGNHITLNARGIVVTDVENLIVGNRALHNGAGPKDDYDVIEGNIFGPISSDPASAGPWANFR